MRIILSPAKKMREDDCLSWQEQPRFLDSTQRILEVLRSMDGIQLKKLWKCNDQIAALNIERLSRMDLSRGLTPAVLAYEGIQYQYMAPGIFTDEEFAYVQQYLRILSGFYGILKPFDGVRPYRLEMQAKLAVDGAKDLYAFWGDRLARSLLEESDCILNLASKEYSLCISRYLPPATPFITCVFGEETNEKIIEKGTLCKMARGEMVRYLAENNVTVPEQVKYFDRLDYHFSERYSDENTYVFLLEKTTPRKVF